jgi:glucose-6-phosphate-specific signal transduction histidine kinase
MRGFFCTPLNSKHYYVFLTLGMQKLIDTLTLRDYKRRVDAGTSEIDLLTARGDQMHVISLCLVFVYATLFTIANFYFSNFPQAYLTLVPIPLSFLFYVFFRWGGKWEVVSKLSNLLVILSLLFLLKLLDGPSTGVMTFFIPVMVASMITFQGRQRVFGWIGVSVSLLVVIFLSTTSWHLHPDQEMSESKLVMERVQNYFGAALATVLEVGFLIWVSNQLQDKLVEKEQEQQRLVTQLALQSQEKQRNEVAVELHENINQILASAKVNLSLIPNTPETSDKISESADHIEYALLQIRKLYQTLVTPDLKEFALTDLLREMVDELFRDQDVRILFDARMDPTHSLSDEVKLSLYRVAQEYLQVLREQSTTRHLDLCLYEENTQLVLSVRDDGGGIDVNVPEMNIAIRSVENRVKLHQGSVRFLTETDKGNVLFVELPLSH